MATDVFISYAREDRETAHQLADALEADTLAVWWDRELIGGGDFAAEIEHRIAEAKVVLVLWSVASVGSGFVRDESSRARDRGTLLPLRIEAVTLPLGFGSLHTLDLPDWDGDRESEAYQELLSQIRTLCKTQAVPRPQVPSPPRLLGLPTMRRNVLVSLGLGGVALAGSAAWWWQSERRRDRREARDRLEQALRFHFSQPPQWESARSAYLDALHLDQDLARAHYFLGHLYVQLLLNQGSTPQEAVQVALLRDANEQFSTALRLDGRNDGLLDLSQQVIAAEQLALLRQRDEATPVARAEPPAREHALAPAPAAVAASAPITTPAPAQTAPALHRPASPEVQTQAQAQARALFEPDRDTRLAASSALTLDAALAAEALPAAIAETVAVLRRPSLDDAARQGLATTLALLRRASPATWRRSQEALRNDLLPALRSESGPVWRGAAQAATAVDEGLALSLGPRQRPVVYLQIAEARQAPVARLLQQRLLEAGYAVPGIETTGTPRAPSQPSLRAQGFSDPALARWCQGLLSQVVGAPATSSILRSAHPTTDTYEIWFDAGVCSRVAGCAPSH
jgi:hypothetical protein